jgi:hypothetical protein
MDWDKAKSMTIVFLLALNLFLTVLVLINRNEYRMDNAQRKAVIELLEANGIHINTNVMLSYRPMKQLDMRVYVYEPQELTSIFFEEEPERIVQLDKVIYTKDDESLTVQNGYITYDRVSGTDSLAPTEQNSQRIASEYLKGMGDIFSSFKPDDIFPYEDGYRVTFCEHYKNYIVYSNMVEIYVTSLGVTRVDIQYNTPVRFDGQAMEICSPDEALLNFMHKYLSEMGQTEAEVERIDLVYIQNERTDQPDAELKAMPYYRVTVATLEAPYIINAYPITN